MLTALATLPLALLPVYAAPVCAPPRHDGPRPGADSIGDPYYPGLGAGGYDVSHYDIVLGYDVESGAVDAVTTVTAVAEHALSSFHLDFHALEVTEITVNGAEAEFTREGRELAVTPAEPLPEGEPFVARIAYGGVPRPVPDPATGGQPVGWLQKDSGVFVSSQCIGASSWFPCNDHQRDRATFAFTVTVAKPYVVAANGQLIEERDHGASRTYVWRANAPMAPYLATIGISEFEVHVDESPSGLPLRTFYPANLSERALAAFGRQGEIIEFLESCFGPYPFESAGAIVADEFLGGALETQTIPVYGRGTFSEEVIAHELAHQWFGDSITVHNWRDMWLNEGFASYGSFLWTEYADGFEAAEERARKMYWMLRRAEIGPPADPGVENIFSPRVYERGAWVLHQLRAEVGDDYFFDILQTWYERKRDQSATTEEFLALCDEVTGRDLSELFARVLFDPVIPVDERYE